MQGKPKSLELCHGWKGAGRTSLKCSLLLLSLLSGSAMGQPLRLHPENPHYFLFRDKPTVLIGSGEHYGAVLNLDFDFVRYLDTVAEAGLSHTRTFSGVYCEPQGAFKIEKNTLAPAPGKYLTPWARSSVPGYANGGNKFDLEKWDDAYFSRLKDFVRQASRRAIVVELDLFCPFYEDAMWRLSPMNAENNVQGIGKVDRTHVYTLDRHGGLLPVHERFVRKVVTELNEFDNLYYEVCNEPYFGGVTMEWQVRMVETIVSTERDLPNRHLISLNIANGAKKIEQPPEGVSIFNFHYASPPDAVALNYDLNRPIGDNETGFKGTADAHYRMEAWEFLLAGGALFSHLDYSFTAGHEDGRFEYPPTQPGGGNPEFRKQMRILKDFLHSFELVRMKPANDVVKRVPSPARVRVLAEAGKQYAIYVFGRSSGDLKLDLPPGTYRSQWSDPLTGAVVGEDGFLHPGGERSFQRPADQEESALSIRASEKAGQEK